MWAYPQPEWSDDHIAFTLCGALLGRVQLSGHIDRMSSRQQELVADAIAAYKEIRADLAVAIPFWPLGLPEWADSWVALGMRGHHATYVVVWHRGDTGASEAPATVVGGADPGEPGEMVLPVAHMLDVATEPEVLYPKGAGAGARWSASCGQLTVSLPRTPSACLIGLPV